MNNTLRVTLIQSDLVWENKGANLQNFKHKIDSISNTDLVILPEMFTTGFSMEVETLSENWGNLTNSNLDAQ